MMTSEELKLSLQSLKQAGYAAPQEAELEQLLAAMLAHIGDPDGELRDELVYATLSHWITRGALDERRMRALLSSALDEQHLFYQLVADDPNAVFTRSFSALLLAALIYAHRQRPFLKLEDLQLVQTRLLDYVRQETDWRGHTQGQGWAHAAAHASDLIDELAQCQELGSEDLSELLSGIGSLLRQSRMPYSCDEGERLSVAAASALQRGLLDLDEWAAWIGWLESSADEESLAAPYRFYRLWNIKGFLHCLYFRVRRPAVRQSLDPDQCRVLESRIETAVHALTRY